MTEIDINHQDFIDLVFYAFRYALGRRSTSVSTISSIIIRKWHLIDQSHRDLIAKEIRDAISSNDAGDLMDVKEWARVLDLYEVSKKK